MNEKITMQDIIDLIAAKHGMARKDAEAFVRGMFELIAEALATENYVKIKGLGTFKLTEVDSRESVNVNTGERIEIQGHTKITFTPDTTMKDQINKPFAHFETVLLNEGTRTEDMEVVEPIQQPQPVEEEVLPKEELVAMPEPETKEETVLPTEKEMPSEEPTPVQEVEEEPVQEVVEEEEPTVKTEKVPVLEAKEEQQPVVEEKVEEEQEERKTPWGIIIAIILVLCLAGGIYWYMHSTPDEPQTLATPVETPQEEAPMELSQDTIIQRVDSTSADTPAPEPSAPVAIKTETPKVVLSDAIEYEITGTKTTLTLQPDETLVKLSLRFYGTKKLWNYIAQHNRDVITDADRVPIGTTLRIPELSPKK